MNKILSDEDGDTLWNDPVDAMTNTDALEEILFDFWERTSGYDKYFADEVKPIKAALLKWRDDQLIAYQAELLADYEADVKNRVNEAVVAGKIAELKNIINNPSEWAEHTDFGVQEQARDRIKQLGAE